jgi:uncharacterized alkaline shock family protein YloU
VSALLENKLGSITYTDDYIGSLVGMVATESYGVVGMASQNKMSDGIVELLGRENLKRGVKVTTDGTNVISIELYIVVQYGLSITASANSIIETIKYQVERSTGLQVKDVNVIVSGIRVQK